MNDGVWGPLLTLAAVGVAAYFFYIEQQASSGMTSKTFYETCWELRSKSAGFKTPEPSNPYQAAQWANCETVVKRAIFSTGMLFAGNDAPALQKVCPDIWTEVPIGGAYLMYIADMEKAGGPSTLNGLLPASFSVGWWATKRWPKCDAARASQGYPKIVEKTPGVFGWEKPCPKCKE